MKKFITKIIFATLIIYIPWICFLKYGKSIYAPVDYIAWEYKHSLLADKGFDPQQIVIGDSLAMTAINPILISKSLYNLAQSGSTPVDAYFFLKKYLDAGKKPKKVILSFGATHWQGSDVFREQSIAYGFMSFEEFSEFIDAVKNVPLFYQPEESIDVFKSWFPFNYFFDSFVTNNRTLVQKLDYFLIKAGLAQLLVNHVKSELFNIIWSEERELKKKMKQEMIANNGQHLFEESKTINIVNPIVNFVSWSIHPVNKIYFEKIVNLLNENSIECELDFVPINSTTWKVLKKEFFEEMSAFLSNYNTITGPIKFNSLESFDIKLMGDMDHVNRDGMIEYSKRFKKRHFQEK